MKKTGKFVLPGLAMIKTRKKAATKGGVRQMFGKEVKVKAQPAKTVAARPFVEWIPVFATPSGNVEN